jgi:deoxyadenosine/deoxycytidine kinase
MTSPELLTILERCGYNTDHFLYSLPVVNRIYEISETQEDINYLLDILAFYPELSEAGDNVSVLVVDNESSNAVVKKGKIISIGKRRVTIKIENWLTVRFNLFYGLSDKKILYSNAQDFYLFTITQRKNTQL